MMSYKLTKTHKKLTKTRKKLANDCWRRKVFQNYLIKESWKKL